jgi:hypothetical protein
MEDNNDSEIITLSSEDEVESKKVDVKPQKKTKIKVWRKDEK